jgi:hypothetical protein
MGAKSMARSAATVAANERIDGILIESLLELELWGLILPA